MSLKGLLPVGVAVELRGRRMEVLEEDSPMNARPGESEDPRTEKKKGEQALSGMSV